MEKAEKQQFETVQNELRKLLERQKLGALLLQKSSSFAWATAGARAYVNTAASNGAASLWITPSENHLLTNTVEAPRLENEELLVSQGWDFVVTPWYASFSAVDRLSQGISFGSDGEYPGARDLSGELARLRARLTAFEAERMRALGKLAALAMQRAVAGIKPGMSENEIAAILGQKTQELGAQPIVNLIAVDERVALYRHPLPTDKILTKYAMLVLCARKWGLVVSITRLIHFGVKPDALKHKEQATASIDATFITQTRPGRTLGEIFAQAVEAYRQNGYPDEWQLHHQGGPAGYEPREYLATPDSIDRVYLGQAYAWNPSITGTKSEDTILVGSTENEVVTQMPDWPVLKAGEVSRPAILEID